VRSDATASVNAAAMGSATDARAEAAPPLGGQRCRNRGAAEEEDALAQLLAHELPLHACCTALERFEDDADAALDFLLDTPEGAQLCQEAEAVASFAAPFLATPEPSASPAAVPPLEPCAAQRLAGVRPAAPSEVPSGEDVDEAPAPPAGAAAAAAASAASSPPPSAHLPGRRGRFSQLAAAGVPSGAAVGAARATAGDPVPAPQQGVTVESAAASSGTNEVPPSDSNAVHTPLALAARAGDGEEVKRLLRARADPNDLGGLSVPPLFGAARYGHAGTTALLLLGRADPAGGGRGGRAGDTAAPGIAANPGDGGRSTATLLRLFLGSGVVPEAQREALEVLDECTRFLVGYHLRAWGKPLAVTDVLSEAEWNYACCADGAGTGSSDGILSS